MRNLTNLHNAYRSGRSPAAPIVDAVIRASNSPEFLVPVLRRVLAAAEADLAADIEREAALLDILTDENGN